MVEEMELAPRVVGHEVEAVEKSQYGNARVEPEGSVESKPSSYQD